MNPPSCCSKIIPSPPVEDLLSWGSEVEESFDNGISLDGGHEQLISNLYESIARDPGGEHALQNFQVNIDEILKGLDDDDNVIKLDPIQLKTQKIQASKVSSRELQTDTKTNENQINP